jgi:hypothetical protein
MGLQQVDDQGMTYDRPLLMKQVMQPICKIYRQGCCFFLIREDIIMGSISTDYSAYLHTYKAVRTAAGQTEADTTETGTVKKEDGAELTLTEESLAQMEKDREAYGNMLQTKEDAAAEKTKMAAEKKAAQDQAKVMTVFHSMLKGDIVPASDENKLMEYDRKLYQAAKTAQMMAQMAEKQKERHKNESLWSDKEEKAYNARMTKLQKESDETAESCDKELDGFTDAQKEAVVEVSSEGQVL